MVAYNLAAKFHQKGIAVSTVAPAVTPEIVKSIAPSGTLLVTLNCGNTVLVQGTPDAPSGVTVDLSRELARRLGVPVKFHPFPGAGEAFEGFSNQKLDIVFLAIEPVRAAQVEFTPPYVIIEGVYMVWKDSALKSVADVDRAGVRIGVTVKAAYELFLTRSLKAATLVRADDGVQAFVDQKLDAAGGVKQQIVARSKALPDTKVLDGRFMEIRQAMGTQKGREVGSAYLKAFIEEMKASGFVADALKRANQPEATVAPPA